MSAHHGRKLGLPDLLSFDMGGTTAKGALVRGFTALKQYDLEVGRVHEFKSGSGLPVKLPIIDMIEIGSGGGSLARVDERGLIRVGAFLLLVEAHRRALGVTSSALHRAIEVRRHSSKPELTQAFEDEVTILCTQVRDAAIIGPRERPAHRGDFRRVKISN